MRIFIKELFYLMNLGEKIEFDSVLGYPFAHAEHLNKVAHF